MIRAAIPILTAFLALISADASGQTAAPPTAQVSRAVKPWIARSNAYTQILLNVDLQHRPETGSGQGLAQFDKLVSRPTLADQLAERKQLEAVFANLKAQLAKETDKDVQLDIEILIKALNLRFRREDFELQREVTFANASENVYWGLRMLLDDQVAAERRPNVIDRLKKYAGSGPGDTPYTEILKQRVLEQVAKPAVIYPAKVQLETELPRGLNFVDEIPQLFEKYKLGGWQEPYAKLKAELIDYDSWLRTNVLPKARTDFRMSPEEYALALENYGVDIAPARIAAMAHAAFEQIQAEMVPIAAQIARQHGYTSNNYRAVIAELKKQQITGQEVLPFYEKRLHDIEQIIGANRLVSLPNRAAIIKLASPAESTESAAP